VKIFNQDVSSSGEIHENFRIFTNPIKQSLETARRDPRTHTPPNIIAYTDRSCTANGTTDTCAGIRVWFSPNSSHNRAEPVGRNLTQSNTTAELLAIYKALQYMPSQANLHIKTDSEWAIKALSVNNMRHIDEHFTNISHANILRPIINKMRKQAGATTLKWIKGHSGIEGNKRADKLAKEGTTLNNTQKTLFITSPEHNHAGA